MRCNLLAVSLLCSLCACLQFSEVLTQKDADVTFSSLQEVIDTHDYFVNTDTRSAFLLLPTFETALTATLQQQKITAPDEGRLCTKN